MSDSTQTTLTQSDDLWATVELMGHAQTAGRVTKPSEWGGLLRVDVPVEDGSFRTEFYGLTAIYSVKFVSEEIARAFVRPSRQIVSYDTPIVTREQHEYVTHQLEQQNYLLREQLHELERRLTAVNALPEPKKRFTDEQRGAEGNWLWGNVNVPDDEDDEDQ